MEVLELLWTVKPLRGFCAPDCLIGIFGLCNSVFGLTASETAMEIIISLVCVEPFNQLLSRPWRLAEEISLCGVIGTQESRVVSFVAILSHQETIVGLICHGNVYRVFFSANGILIQLVEILVSKGTGHI